IEIPSHVAGQLEVPYPTVVWVTLVPPPRMTIVYSPLRVPRHVPTNDFRFAVGWLFGVGDKVFAFVEVSELSLALGLTTRFDFGLADWLALGVELSISWIGAGRRCTGSSSNTAARTT